MYILCYRLVYICSRIFLLFIFIEFVYICEQIKRVCACVVIILAFVLQLKQYSFASLLHDYYLLLILSIITAIITNTNVHTCTQNTLLINEKKCYLFILLYNNKTEICCLSLSLLTFF